MKKLKTLTLLLLIPILTIAQDDTNERKIVDFIFGDNTFSQTLPFDQFFTIRFKDVPASVRTIQVELFEFDNKKYISTIKSDSQITEAMLNKAGKIFLLGPASKFLPTDKNILLAVPVKLKPNFDYVIRVKGDTTRVATTREKIDVSNQLNASNVFNDFYHELVTTYLEKEEFSNALLSSLQNRLNNSIEIELQKIDKSYHLQPINLEQQLGIISTITTSIKDINDIIGIGFISNQAIGRDSNSKAIISTITNYKNVLLSIDWSSIKKNDNIYNDLVNKTHSLLPAILPTMKISTDSTILRENLTTLITEIDKIIAEKSNLTTSLIVTTRDHLIKTETINGTYRADFVKNARLYITLDAGLAYTWRIDRVLFYSGTNIYFRPVNKGIPLSHYKKFWDYIGVRTSLLLGITFTDFEKANIRKGLIGNSALVLGAGYRINPFLKLNGGTMVYYRFSENTLFAPSRNYTTFSPFVSLSLDLDVKSLVGGIGTSLFK